MNQQALLRKARQLQKEMLETQQEIEATEFKMNCGPISMVMLGNKSIKSVTIEEGYQIEDNDDKEMLESSFVAASNSLIKEIDNFTEEKMAKYKAYLGGMGGF